MKFSIDRLHQLALIIILVFASPTAGAATVTDDFSGGTFDTSLYEGTLATQNNGTLTQSGGVGRFSTTSAPPASQDSHGILITKIKGDSSSAWSFALDTTLASRNSLSALDFDTDEFISITLQVSNPSDSTDRMFHGIGFFEATTIPGASPPTHGVRAENQLNGASQAVDFDFLKTGIGDDDSVTTTLTVEYDGVDTLTAKYTFNAVTTTSLTYDVSSWDAFTEFNFSIIGISGSIAGNQQPAEVADDSLATFDGLNATGAGITVVPEPKDYGWIFGVSLAITGSILRRKQLRSDSI